MKKSFTLALAAGLLCSALASAVQAGDAAAVPSVASHAKPAVDIVGGDSRADDYRLERDSCCIGN